MAVTPVSLPVGQQAVACSVSQQCLSITPSLPPEPRPVGYGSVVTDAILDLPETDRPRMLGQAGQNDKNRRDPDPAEAGARPLPRRRATSR